MASDDAPIAFWSEAMFAAIRRTARKYANRWYMEEDDLAQECCVALAARVRRQGDAPIFPQLLTKICRDRISEYRRARNDRRAREAAEFDETPGPAAADADATMDVADAVARLKPAQRAVVEGRFMRFHSLQDLAEAWRMRPKGVAKRQLVAFDALRGGLSAGYGNDERRLRDTPPNHEARHIRQRRPSWSDRDWSRWGRIPNQRTDDY